MSPSKKKTNDFLVQGSILAAASIISRLIGLIYRIPVMNIIGDSGNADYSNAFEIYNIVLILSSFSLPLSVSKLVSARNEKKEYINSYRIFLCAMAFAVFSGILFTLILYFGADFFASYMFKMPSSAIPLKVLAPTVLISAVMGVLRGFYQGKKTMIPTALSQILEQIVNAVVSIAASYLFMKKYSASPNIEAYGAAGSTLGTCLGALVSLVFLGFIFIAYRPTLKKQFRRDTESIIMPYKKIFTLLMITIIPVVLSQTVYNISGTIDSSLFGNILARQGVVEDTRKTMYGVYSGQYRLLTNLPIAIASALAASMVPSIVSAHARKDKEDLTEKIKSSIHFNMLIAFPSAVGMTVLAKPIISLLFPNSSGMAANLLATGSIAIIFYALSTVSNAILQGINQMKIPVIHSAVSLAIHVVIVILALQVFNMGTYGLVLGNVTFALIVCILNWISIGKHLNYKQELKKSFIIPAISSIIMGIITWLAYQGIYLLINSNMISTLLSIIIAIIVYFIALLLLKGVDMEELYSFPLGRTLSKIAMKLHLL
ncbi:stage V sporulation protein B [Mobilisporobacter senegalensis]|uniref:Stage V sporulation protein B n=1 Tax=Mobilisporobacter senegalensis TaxID=1329262 RepID=A0A3N1XT36_9FIRM|nr:polysaccharide biosynthesis protein [Mobilisporobacter senegalensis]ROR29321.1 stage V sporulation protein B [Mobilisporobacter senegalensis]